MRVLSNANKDIIGILFRKARKLFIAGICPIVNPRLFNNPLAKAGNAPKIPVKTRTTVRFTLIKKIIMKIKGQRRLLDGIRARTRAKDTP